MARIKYYYDTETCKYERIKTTTGDVILNVLSIVSLTMAMAVGLLLLGGNYFESPKELLLRNEVKEMEFYYQNMEVELQKLEKQLASMEYRDDNIYRAVLGAEPIDLGVRQGGIGGSDRFEDIRSKNIDHEEVIIQLQEMLGRLKRKVYVESKSQDDVVALAENKEKLFAAIPAIQPVANEELIGLASGFGMRIHPVYKVFKMHTGAMRTCMDLPCAKVNL